MPCDRHAESLPGVVDGSARLDRSGRRHVASCLRCQADLAQYRRLMRTMVHLGEETLTPPPGLLTEILAAVELAGESRSARLVLTGRKVAYVGGIAAATAAAGAGAAIVFTRGRRGRLPLAG